MSANTYVTIQRHITISASQLTRLQADGLGVDEVVLVELGEDRYISPLGHDEVVGALVGAPAHPLHFVRSQCAAEGEGGERSGVRCHVLEVSDQR